MSKRDRRVAARTETTTTPRTPAGGQTQGAPPAEPTPAPEPADGDTTLAKVIPLGIFDPFTEADKRW